MGIPTEIETFFSCSAWFSWVAAPRCGEMDVYRPNWLVGLSTQHLCRETKERLGNLKDANPLLSSALQQSFCSQVCAPDREPLVRWREGETGNANLPPLTSTGRTCPGDPECHVFYHPSPWQSAGESFQQAPGGLSWCCLSSLVMAVQRPVSARPVVIIPVVGVL